MPASNGIAGPARHSSIVSGAVGTLACESPGAAPWPGKCFSVLSTRPRSPATAAATRSAADCGSPPSTRPAMNDAGSAVTSATMPKFTSTPTSDSAAARDPKASSRGRRRRRAELLRTRRAVPREALHLAALLVDAEEHRRVGVGLHGLRQRRELGGRGGHVVAHQDEPGHAGVHQARSGAGSVPGAWSMSSEAAFCSIESCDIRRSTHSATGSAGAECLGDAVGADHGARRSGRGAPGDADERRSQDQRHRGGSDRVHPGECTLRVRAAAECPRG